MTTTRTKKKRDQTQLTIHISEKAAKHVRHFARSEGRATGEEEVVGLRVGVKGGGCSGLTYELTLDADATDSDKIMEENGVRLVVDKKSYVYLAGTILDFSDGLNGKGFVFDNPNARTSCGCGTSFSV